MHSTLGFKCLEDIQQFHKDSETQCMQKCQESSVLTAFEVPRTMEITQTRSTDTQLEYVYMLLCTKD